MGNRKLRKQLALKLKEKGYGKLYSGCRRRAFRWLSAPEMRQTLFMLNLKEGDLVNNCDSYNHFVKVVPKPRWSFYCGKTQRTRVKIFDNQVEFTDGSLSCGCPTSPEPPLSVDAIRKTMFHTPEEIADLKEGGWWTEKDQLRQDRLEAGLPICDEHGCKLVE